MGFNNVKCERKGFSIDAKDFQNLIIIADPFLNEANQFHLKTILSVESLLWLSSNEPDEHAWDVGSTPGLRSG